MRETKTLVCPVDPTHPQLDTIELAAAVLRRGGLVAFPTETVYGLGANALNEAAVERIFAAKGRPGDNPLIVHLASGDALDQVAVQVNATSRTLAERFWPGPLALILPRAPRVPAVTSAGLDTVAVRVPSHPVARALIAAAGVPVAAPSANLSGRPSPTTAQHVQHDLAGRVDLILDGGPSGVGVESTVVDARGSRPLILRPGGITPEMILAAVGSVELVPEASGETEASGPVMSPGMKYRHYAPQAPAVLVEGPAEAVAVRVSQLAEEALLEGRRVGIIATREWAGYYPKAALTAVYGERSRPESCATGLYTALRACDQAGVDMLIIEGIEPTGIGLAVMNRLRRAVGGRIERVGHRHE